MIRHYLHTSVDGFPPLDPKNREWDTAAGRSVEVLGWMKSFEGIGSVPVLARYLYEIEQWQAGGHYYPAKAITRYAILEEPEG